MCQFRLYEENPMGRAFPFFAAVVAMLCLAPRAAAAQTADDIIAKNLQSKGGLELLKNTTTVRMIGSVTASGQKVSMTMTAKRPNLVRRDVTNGDRTNTVAYDGADVWRQAAPMPPERIPAAEAGDVKQQAEFDGVFVDYKEKGRLVELIGKETVKGRPVYHLTVARVGEPVQHYYLDAETGLEARVSVEEDRGGAKVTTETELSDYRQVQGRTMPFHMRQLVNGAPVADISIQKIEFDVPVETAFFKMQPK
jgi:hypothetical protein